ncbi:MAG: NTPase [Chloroflexi bacterium]|nr:NTPase [Chloroflexota bacterium]
MKSALFLTGGPGVGKTTIIKESITHFKGSAGGFYTEEIREQGVRQGFNIVTLEGEKAVLAHITISSPHRVGKYGVDVANLNRVGVAALWQAMRERDIVVVDEVGRMELFSAAFRDAVRVALDRGKRVLGTIMLRADPWADEVKSHPLVELLVVTRTNHQEVLAWVNQWLESPGPME